jgi:hypothetical protein
MMDSTGRPKYRSFSEIPSIFRVWTSKGDLPSREVLVSPELGRVSDSQLFQQSRGLYYLGISDPLQGENPLIETK